jgi:hypothetical protein
MDFYKKKTQKLISNVTAGFTDIYRTAAPSTSGPRHAKGFHSAVTDFLRTCTEYCANKINYLFIDLRK